MSLRVRYLTCAVAAAFGIGAHAQSLAGCPMFPYSNVWNTPIDQLPVDANSSAYINAEGASKALHPDFSATGYGIPYVVVTSAQAQVPVVFTYASESDPGPYPVPPNAPIEGGSGSTGDRHVLVLDSSACVLYEMYNSWRQADGSWKADSGAKFDLNSNQLRPDGWTSADAAGFAILPGLVRYDEVASGEIRHAIRMTVPSTRNAYIWPARHRASSLTGTQYPPMGQRFRLKASFDITPYPADVQVILKALKKYGALVADNGSAWYLSGAPDSRWNDTTLHTLGQVLGSNLEAVDESSLMVDPNSGAVNTAVSLSAVQLNPTAVTGGASTTQNRVVLTGAAGSSGASVALSSSNPAAASVPPSVLVAAGSSSAAFSIATSAVSAATQVTISAFYLGVTTTATLTVSPVALAGLTISPASVTSGGTATGTVTLNGPAPAGGAIVNVASSNTSIASAPSTVPVEAGASSASFPISTGIVSTSTVVTFTATYNGSTTTAGLTVNPVSQKYTVTAPATAKVRTTISVGWTAPAGHAANDFVGLYRSNGTLVWSQTTGTGTSGSFTVLIPTKQGQYSVRYVLGTTRATAAQTVINVTR